jgi:hypothetical protein
MSIPRIALLVAAALPLVSVSSTAQEAPAQSVGSDPHGSIGASATLSCKPAADRDQRLPLPKPGPYRFSDIRSTFVDNFGRALKFTLEIKDTPDFLLTEFTVPDPRGGEDRTVPGFIPNPDERLTKGTAEISFSRVFSSTGDLKSLYSTVSTHKDRFDISVDPLAAEDDPVAYFMRTRGRDWVARLVSGFTISFALSERPTPDPTADIPVPVRDRIAAADQYEEVYSVKFDPFPLFNTGSHRSEAAQALTAYATTFKPRRDVATGLQIATLCASPHPHCLGETSALYGSGRWLAALLPTFEYKTVDQFDFVQYGSRFLRPFFFDESLEVYTLTWDLSRVLDRQKERTATLDAIAAVEKLAAAPPVIAPPTSTPIVAGQAVYLKLKATAGVKPLAWSVQRSDCVGASVSDGMPFPGLGLDGAVLAGYAQLDKLSAEAAEAGDHGRGSCGFEIAVEDALGRVDRLSCAIGEPATSPARTPGS